MNFNITGSKVGINCSNNLDFRRISSAVVTDHGTPMSGVEDDIRTVIPHTPFLFTRCGADLRFRFVSDAYARMLALRPSQIIGRPIVEIISENALRTIMPHIRKALRGRMQ